MTQSFKIIIFTQRRNKIFVIFSQKNEITHRFWRKFKQTDHVRTCKLWFHVYICLVKNSHNHLTRIDLNKISQITVLEFLVICNIIINYERYQKFYFFGIKYLLIIVIEIKRKKDIERNVPKFVEGIYISGTRVRRRFANVPLGHSLLTHLKSPINLSTTKTGHVPYFKISSVSQNS